ncbi:hypothetical protein [Nonomuraea lactucae]|uniref:hypothetical protein n=1 Tax=Nonomuraea lactucae TaxID=2249762 RepID=UPI000DE31DDD|nr:hypothetical protein [Nonomuraea lactucae]
MSNSEPLDTDLDNVEEPNEHESWDDFWAEVQRKEAAERTGPPTQTIRGVEVRVPHDLPLLFERKVDQLKDASDEAAFAELVAELFGVDVLDAWIDAGMTGREFEVVLAWGMANGKGRTMSFREAYELIQKRNNNQGKAPASSTRKSARSGGSGRSSKRTSGASTASRRKR